MAQKWPECDLVYKVKRNKNMSSAEIVSIYGGTNTSSESDSSQRKDSVKGGQDPRLLQFINRIENLEEEKKTLADDIRDVFAEAKATGYDVKILRQVIRLRKISADDRREQEQLLDLYMAALGMIE